MQLKIQIEGNIIPVEIDDDIIVNYVTEHMDPADVYPDIVRVGDEMADKIAAYCEEHHRPTDRAVDRWEDVLEGYQIVMEDEK